MNADSLYQLHRDDAFTDQFSSDTYETFLAMPFSSRDGFNEPQVLGKFHEAHHGANQQTGLKRIFSKLQRVDDVNPAAIVITDEIIRRILYSHFFVADLTGNNQGVLIEVGLALALKPNNRVLLFTQDDPSLLHFDIKVTNVNRYTPETLVDKVACALRHAATSFEQEGAKYISLVSSQLTPDAIAALNCYGRRHKGNTSSVNPSLWELSAAAMSDRFAGANGSAAFHGACRELIHKRLFWTHYETGISGVADAYGIHATNLGWAAIEALWSHDPEMRKPKHAITGPNNTKGRARLVIPANSHRVLHEGD